MKTSLNQLHVIATTLVLLLASCEISEEPIFENSELPQVSASESAIKPFAYEQEIVYLQAGLESIKPTIQTELEGTFSASPKGLLALDPNTGEINLRRSETGISYTINFVSDDGLVNASQELLISGIDYRQGLFGKESLGKLVPVYNNDPTLTLPRGSFRASSELVALDPETGIIDLRQTFLNGALGKDGHGIFRIKYQLQDLSEGAINSIQVEIYHFESVESIPATLVAKVSQDKGTYRSGEEEEEDDERPPTVIIVD